MIYIKKRGIAVENKVFKKLPISLDNTPKGCIKYNISKTKSYRNPFFSLKNEKETLSSFIDAINSNMPESALSFVSSRVSGIDINELEEIFKHKSVCKCMAVLPYTHIKGYISVALQDTKSQKSEIVHVRMVKEPNSNSLWKIFEIIRE